MSGVFGEVQVSPQQEKRAISDIRKTKGFAIGKPPDPKKHFYIPNAADVDFIVNEMIQNGNKYLIRGPPACGKTTLAEALCRHHPYCTKRGDDCEQSFVLIHGNELKAPKDVAENQVEKYIIRMFIEKLKNATKDELDVELGAFSTDMLKPVFSWLDKRNVVMVIDEAHIVFEKIYSLFKNSDTTVLFFTTTPELAMANETSKQVWPHSPPELAAKYYWSGGINNIQEVEKALKQTNVRLELNAVQALIQISGDHRGVFVRLCNWVRQHQFTPQA